MPLISNKNIQKSERIQIKLKKNILQESKNYQAWAGIAGFNDFVESCIEYVLNSDKEWKKLKMDKKLK